MIGSVTMMNEYSIYKYEEFILFVIYLILIFLLVQIWFLWKDADKKELVSRFINDSFFKKNCIYVFLFSSFFMLHEFLEGINISNAMVFYEFIELLALISLLLFAYNWYVVLKMCSIKKPVTIELRDFCEE